MRITDTTDESSRTLPLISVRAASGCANCLTRADRNSELKRLKPTDVVIIGSGFAGLVMAKEIATRTALNVVVLERGPADSPLFKAFFEAVQQAAPPIAYLLTRKQLRGHAKGIAYRQAVKRASRPRRVTLLILMVFRGRV